MLEVFYDKKNDMYLVQINSKELFTQDGEVVDIPDNLEEYSNLGCINNSPRLIRLFSKNTAI